MTDTPDNPPAFPLPGMTGLPNDNVCWPEHGMTLLDWFAGMALQGIVAATGGRTFRDSATHDAKSAYDLSEAMLAERARRLK